MFVIVTGPLRGAESGNESDLELQPHDEGGRAPDPLLLVSWNETHAIPMLRPTNGAQQLPVSVAFPG